MKNKGTWIIVGIVAAFVLLIAGIFVSTNNRAVSLEEQVFTADSDIQAQEKRRTDLIYNLADCVKEYDKHEAETLLNVVEARGNNGSTTDIENVTTSIAAVAEAYPELKSNTEYSGVIYTNLKDNTIEDGTPFIQADTIDEAVDYMVSNGTAGLVIFWVVWVILIGAAVFGFCYFDNKWLED